MRSAQAARKALNFEEVSMDTLYDMADGLAKARSLRLKGQVLEALIFEEKCEAYIRCEVGDELADELLSLWEGSLEDHPFRIEEWVKASGHGQ
jgi:hypothetical protein